MSSALAYTVACGIPLWLIARHGVSFWIKRKFIAHRLLGLGFLAQYTAAWAVFIYSYDTYLRLWFPFTLSANLICQVFTAIHYFRFLPKGSSADPGMYSDKGVLPYAWVQENLFFALMITWGNVYYDPRGIRLIRDEMGAAGFVLEIVWVFFPWVTIRHLFPKTHFRDALKNHEKTVTPQNRSFYFVFTWVLKIFYVLHKHAVGQFLNYCVFAGALAPPDLYWLHWMMLVNIGTHTIGTFTHTLRFKRLLHPRLAFSVYILYWTCSYWAVYKLLPLYLEQRLLLGITVLGMCVNFMRSRALALGYQVLVCTLCIMKRPSQLPYGLATAPEQSDQEILSAAFDSLLSTLQLAAQGD